MSKGFPHRTTSINRVGPILRPQGAVR